MYASNGSPKSCLSQRRPASYLVHPLGRAHAGLDGQAPHILPALLQQTDQVIDGQHDITDQLILGHADIADGDAQTQDLLQLELDGAPDLGHLDVEILGVGDRGGKLAGLGEAGPEEAGDLAHQGVGGDEGVVLARQLLDQLLVLVELLQVVGRHGVDAVVLGPVDVVLVAEDAGDWLIWACLSKGNLAKG